MSLTHTALMQDQPGIAKSRLERSAVFSVTLWLFILVASTLFALFLVAYIMRMRSADWSQFVLPWQLQLSTGLLIAASLCLQLAGNMAAASKLTQARTLLWTGGTCALAFLAVQYWAWQVLLALGITGTGNPAASFFYLLTAMHALHVIAGLLCWVLVLRFVLPASSIAALPTAATGTDLAACTWRIQLCARYWHFLLLLWLVLYAALTFITPELVEFICGPR